jgi:uncharacterized membrane protein YjgN (DUF898 family)
MSTLEAAVPPAPAPITAPIAGPAAGTVRFFGDGRSYWRLLIRGAVLLMFTLGIYRFWLATDIRRFLWSGIELSGDSFEYTGTAAELLQGFLMALAILVPLYSVFFIVALGGGVIGDTSGLLSFVLLTLLGHYAIYRARRYRLTRTVFRGIRFHQTGSAWRYALCASLWWSLTILTLGLAFPAAQARLERFKMRHTFFGNQPGRFEGSASRLLLRGILLWVLAVVPLTVGLVATIASINWTTFGNLGGLGNEALLSWLIANGIAAATLYLTLTLIWLVLALAILYPIFHAMFLRWWASGLRFGDIVVTSKLRTGQIYGIYIRFLWYSFLWTIAGIVVGSIGAVVIGAIVGDTVTILGEIFATTAAIGLYVAMALGYSTIYQATVKLGVWRCVVDTLEVANTAVLDRVSAAGEPSSPVGEGLADALNVGGI